MSNFIIHIKNFASFVAATLYTFCPIDIIPDYIPGVGFGDDIVFIIIAAVYIFFNIKKLKKK